MVQLVIPITDDSTHFPESQYFFPKPLIDINGTPLILEVIRHLLSSFKTINKLVLVVPSDLENKYRISQLVSIDLPLIDVSVAVKWKETSGALTSTLLAIDLLNADDELIVANMDDFLFISGQDVLNFYRESSCDAGVITFNSSHPRWCYCKMSTDGEIQGFHEKSVVSKHALAGFYYFRNKDLFVHSSFESLRDDCRVNNSHYLSATLNSLLLNSCKVGNFSILPEQRISIYSPKNIQQYIDHIKTTKLEKTKNSEKETFPINILLPSAGAGSRFKTWMKPKPFIDINGRPMIAHVIENTYLPNSKHIAIFQRKDVLNYQLDFDIVNSLLTNYILVDGLTDGTACTVLKACSEINNDSPLVIANSDQIVDGGISSFVHDAFMRDLDGSILVFRDVSRNPKWSFAKVNPESSFVEQVAEKKPISDLATVGIYYFKRGSDFVEAAIQMILNKDLVNNEYYTCPVYNNMISAGLTKIGVFEISPNEMHGLGTPDDLNNFLVTKQLPPSISSPSIES